MINISYLFLYNNYLNIIIIIFLKILLIYITMTDITTNNTYENNFINNTLVNNTNYYNIINADNIYFLSYITFLQVFIYNFIYLLDYLLCKYYTDKARWFQLHSLANLFVCIFCISDITSIVYDVNEAVMPLTQYIGGSFALQVHLYHTLNFPLTTMDKYHHIS